MIPQQSKTVIIYCGGTFGCVGQPLSPLGFHTIKPFIAQLALQHKLQADYYSAPCIKDSSQIEPSDWCDLIRLILDGCHQGYSQFLIIYGTDTLAYTAGFLYAALNHAVIKQQQPKIVITGSQYPLLVQTEQGLSLATDSDARGNFALACKTLMTLDAMADKVCVCFNQQVFTGGCVQKTHTTDLHAFAGKPPSSLTVMQSKPLDDKGLAEYALANLPWLKARLEAVNIQILYVLPYSVQQLCTQLAQVIAVSLDAVIIMTLGAGNLIQHPDIQRLLVTAKERGVLVFVSTQVPFGGTHTSYAAGHWLLEAGVVFTGQYPVSTVYSQILWVCAIAQDIRIRRDQLEAIYSDAY